MTKNELFDRFNTAWGSLEPNLNLHEAFDSIIGPHLNIPRSLNDDPPQDGQRVILLYLQLDHTTDVRIWPNISDALRHEINSGRLTHWIPAPVEYDKDEAEFDEWWSNLPGADHEGKVNFKICWLAARGRK